MTYFATRRAHLREHVWEIPRSFDAGGHAATGTSVLLGGMLAARIVGADTTLGGAIALGTFLVVKEYLIDARGRLPRLSRDTLWDVWENGAPAASWLVATWVHPLAGLAWLVANGVAWFHYVRDRPQ